MEEPRELSHPPKPKVLQEPDHPSQAIFYNTGEVFMLPLAWGSTAMGSVPTPHRCSSSGEVRVPSPSQPSAADGARYVPQAMTAPGDSQRWSQLGLPSGGQPRLAPISFTKPVHPPGSPGVPGRAASAAWERTGTAASNRQRNGPCPHQTPRESSAERGWHTEGPGGRWHPSCRFF